MALGPRGRATMAHVYVGGTTYCGALPLGWRHVGTQSLVLGHLISRGCTKCGSGVAAPLAHGGVLDGWARPNDVCGAEGVGCVGGGVGGGGDGGPAMCVGRVGGAHTRWCIHKAVCGHHRSLVI